MANLAELSQWADGIHQLETTDEAIGGPDGMANLQAKQLANRTQFLKALILAAQNSLAGHEAAADPHPQYLTTAEGNSLIATAVSALVNSSPATLDTLNELAAALGNDPNFATTILSALALKAPLVSPTFSGAPAAPTPDQFDNDTSLATTAFVQRALGNLAGIVGFSSSSTISAADAGKAIHLGGAGGTITLPATGTVPAGSLFTFVSINASWTISPNAGQTIYNGKDVVSNVSAIQGDTAQLYYQGSGYWIVIFGSASLYKMPQFSASVVANGYQKLPSGMIIQWGLTANDNTVKNFPIAFPTACVCLTGTRQGNGFPGSNGLSSYVVTTSTFKVFYSTGVTGDAIFWIAIGY